MNRHLSIIAGLGMCFFAPITTAYAQHVKADIGGIAIGGSVTSSTVIVGIPQEKVDELVRDAKRPLEELTAQQRENIALLKEKLDLNERQVRAALSILGENDIPAERLAAKLVEIAGRFKELQATTSAQPGDDPKVAALKSDAQKAIDAGELAKADAVLADVETEQRRALDRLAVNAAETSARRGEISLARLRYVEAAKHFANAAGVFPPNSAYEDKRISYLQKEAGALFQQGGEFGDNGALLSAIERYKRLVDLAPRERVPLDWARTQDGLGIALTIFGRRESGTVKLEEAVATFREALKERTRERVPLDWAMTQTNLGAALFRLGERDSGTAKLKEAVAVYRQALQERTRERAPLEWATTQHNLGNALFRLGERESGTAKLEEAIAAYREALKEWTRERAPLPWALIQNDLGVGLFSLGQRESGMAKFEEAVAVYREALKEQTRERVPLAWAQTQTNLGLALWRLGERESGTAKLEEAIAAYREALKEHTREQYPRDWAVAQNNLGIALFRLGERETGTAKLEEAIAAYREALKEHSREQYPLDWAGTFGNEGVALMLLAERRQDAAMAGTALSQISKAVETMRNGGNAPSAAFYEQQLPRARAIVARLRGR
jgi:tetratricopeptide (TPR) repeat protein